MFTRIDRVQVAVPDRVAAARGWTSLLGAEHDGEDRVELLAAKRSVYRLGTGYVELLEPDGAGRVADAVDARGAHLFAAGVATPDIDACVAGLRARGAEPGLEGGQAYLDAETTGGHGLRVVISAAASGVRVDPVGLVDHLYEVTNLVSDAPPVVAHYADLFGLDAAAFQPIDSSHYGYEGTLTLFDPVELDRFEVIAPGDPTTTMGRYFAKVGASLYMAFAESGSLPEIAERARDQGVGVTIEPAPDRQNDRGPHTVFLHPNALGGMMLGLSRRTYAWRWSGHPERIDGGI